jgi:hypothetical protein
MFKDAGAQASLGARSVPGDDLGLVVEAGDTRIVIRAARGSFRATYKKLPDFPQLVLQSDWCGNRKESATLLARLRTRAWRLANDTANELGWFYP